MTQPVKSNNSTDSTHVLEQVIVSPSNELTPDLAVTGDGASKMLAADSSDPCQSSSTAQPIAGSSAVSREDVSKTYANILLKGGQIGC